MLWLSEVCMDEAGGEDDLVHLPSKNNKSVLPVGFTPTKSMVFNSQLPAASYSSQIY